MQVSNNYNYTFTGLVRVNPTAFKNIGTNVTDMASVGSNSAETALLSSSQSVVGPSKLNFTDFITKRFDNILEKIGKVWDRDVETVVSNNHEPLKSLEVATTVAPPSAIVLPTSSLSTTTLTASAQTGVSSSVSGMYSTVISDAITKNLPKKTKFPS